MNKEAFLTSWGTLLHAFPSDRVSDESRDVYWIMLREIPDDLWTKGVSYVLANNQFFPTIHELGVGCCGEQKEEKVWREDPFRSLQRWQEKIEAKSWQENLLEIRKQRGLLPKPEREIEFFPKPRKSRPSSILRKKNEAIQRLKGKLDEQLTENVKLRAELREKSRLDRVEENKRRIREQAKQLGVN